MNVLQKPVLYMFIANHSLSYWIKLPLFFGTELPTGPSGVRNPFTFLECDAQGGENTFEEADASRALILGQMPFYSVKVPFFKTCSAICQNSAQVSSTPSLHAPLLSSPLPPPPLHCYHSSQIGLFPPHGRETWKCRTCTQC